MAKRAAFANEGVARGADYQKMNGITRAGIWHVRCTAGIVLLVLSFRRPLALFRRPLALLALSNACSVPIVAEDNSNAGDDSRLSQSAWTHPAHPPAPSIWLVVVDDAPTRDARQQREKAAGWIFSDPSSSCDVNDPAHQIAGDDRLIIVAGSRPHLSATSFSRTDWAVGQRTWGGPELLAARAAISEHLVAQVSLETRPLRVLDAMLRWQRFFTGELAEATSEERSFVSALPTRFSVQPLVIATRDDQSEAHGLLDRPRLGRFWSSTGVSYLDSSRGSCHENEIPELIPHLAHGLRQLNVACATDPFSLVADCRLSCVRKPADVVQGQVACRVFMHLEKDEPCSEARGWFDPRNEVGRNVSPFDAEPSQRVCEIRQLSGKALESCQTDPLCSDCDAGWCLRQRWTDGQQNRFDLRSESSGCSEEEVFVDQIRFTSGSNIGDGRVQVICNH